MDLLVKIPINLVSKLIYEAPFAAGFVAVLALVYYKLTRKLVRLANNALKGNEEENIDQEKKETKSTLEEMATEPHVLYDATISFAMRAGEFIFLMAFLIFLSGKAGFIEDPGEFFFSCMPKR